jgi:hypothetical protein
VNNYVRQLSETFPGVGHEYRREDEKANKNEDEK